MRIARVGVDADDGGMVEHQAAVAELVADQLLDAVLGGLAPVPDPTPQADPTDGLITFIAVQSFNFANADVNAPVDPPDYVRGDVIVTPGQTLEYDVYLRDSAVPNLTNYRVVVGRSDPALTLAWDNFGDEPGETPDYWEFTHNFPPPRWPKAPRRSSPTAAPW